MALRPLQCSPSGQTLVGTHRAPKKTSFDQQQEAEQLETKKGQNIRGRIVRFFSPVAQQQQRIVSAKNTTTNGALEKTTQTCEILSVDQAVNTEITVEDLSEQSSVLNVKEMLFSEQPSMAYWKSLAEHRQTVIENMCDENSDLCRQLSALREENLALQAVAEEARSLRNLLAEAIEQYEQQ